MKTKYRIREVVTHSFTATYHIEVKQGCFRQWYPLAPLTGYGAFDTIREARADIEKLIEMGRQVITMATKIHKR